MAANDTILQKTLSRKVHLVFQVLEQFALGLLAEVKLQQMNTKLSPQQLQLLQEIVNIRCPELISSVETDTHKLSLQDRRTILNAIRNEFASSGLGGDYEPTKRGLQIEELQEILNRPNFKHQKPR
jgi:hypothetical protein